MKPHGRSLEPQSRHPVRYADQSRRSLPAQSVEQPSPRRPKKEKPHFMERHSTVLVASGAATFLIGSLGLPNFMDWFKTREQTTIAVEPVVANVEHYAAIVTGTAKSDFSVEGTVDCPGVGGMEVKNDFHSVATIASRVGTFTVTENVELNQVQINVNEYPELESGFEMEKTKIDADEDGFFTACSGDHLVRVQRGLLLTAQATANTVDECIVNLPEFQQGYHDSLLSFGQTMYPGSTVNVVLPQIDGQQSDSISALDQLRIDVANDGINIETGPIDNCTFEEFKMEPIVLDMGRQDG